MEEISSQHASGVVDIHHHFYPMQYIEELSSLSGSIRVESLTPDLVRLVSPDFHIDLDRSFWEVEPHLEMMDKCGIKQAILSLANPWTEAISPADAPQLARLTNNAIASVIAKHHSRFLGLATLPLGDPEASVIEARRAIKEHGFRGVIAGTHIHGRRLDNEVFWPIFEELQDLGATLFIHPTMPPEVPKPNDLSLIPILWFPIETTITATRLILNGVTETFQRLKFVLAHAGGALPYLMGRIEHGYRVFKATRAKTLFFPTKWPENIYLDAITYRKETLEAAVKIAGSARLLYGTDYPFSIAEPNMSLRIVMELDMGVIQKQDILHNNAISIFNLD